MATTVAERQVILNDLNTLVVRDIVDLWRDSAALDSNAFRSVIINGLSDVIDPYAATAADLSATWYEESAPELAFRATPAPLAPAEQFAASARWALRAVGEAALVRLAGTAQRAIFNAHRQTIVGNVRTEQGSRWARHASANACGFCRMLATRLAVYSTEEAAYLVGAERWEAKRNHKGQKVGFEIGRKGRTRGNQEAGARYHDHCRCMAVEVRPGHSYEPPPYVEQWEADYIAAVRATDGVGEHGAIDPKAVAAHMDGADRARKAAVATKPPAPATQSGPGGRKPPGNLPPGGGRAVGAADGDGERWPAIPGVTTPTYRTVAADGKAYSTVFVDERGTPERLPDLDKMPGHVLYGWKNRDSEHRLDTRKGHLWGSEVERKTWFPEHMSEQQIVELVRDTIENPSHYRQVGPKRFTAKDHDGNWIIAEWTTINGEPLEVFGYPSHGPDIVRWSNGDAVPWTTENPRRLHKFEEVNRGTTGRGSDV